MSTRVVRGGELTPEQRRVHRVEHILRRDGGSPGNALEGLAAIVEDGTWRKVPRDVDDPRPFVTFRKFVEAKAPFGLGYSIKQLEALLQLAHPREEQHTEMRERMDAMRKAVRTLLKEETEPNTESRGRTVTERNSRIGDTNPNVTQSNDSVYILSRLKRADPELAKRVVNGEITANAAARQKGWRKPRVVLTSPESIARSLRKHLGPDDIARLIKYLIGEGTP